jgi:hypothetical protein
MRRFLITSFSEKRNLAKFDQLAKMRRIHQSLWPHKEAFILWFSILLHLWFLIAPSATDHTRILCQVFAFVGKAGRLRRLLRGDCVYPSPTHSPVEDSEISHEHVSLPLTTKQRKGQTYHVAITVQIYNALMWSVLGSGRWHSSFGSPFLSLRFSSLFANGDIQFQPCQSNGQSSSK